MRTIGYTTLPQLPPRPPPTHATPPLHDRCYRGRATFAAALAPCVSDHASPSDGSFASARQRPPRPLGEGAPVHDHLQHDFGIVLSPRGMHDGERGARTPIPTKRAPRHDERALEGRTGVRPAGGALFYDRAACWSQYQLLIGSAAAHTQSPTLGVVLPQLFAIEQMRRR